MGWADLKAGDTLFYVKNKRRIFGGKTIQAWAKKTVTKVTKVFYFIGEDQFRKDKGGKEFMERLYLPGQDGAPVEVDEEKEDLKFKELCEADIKVGSGRWIINLDGLDLFTAAKFAEELEELAKRIDEEKRGS